MVMQGIGGTCSGPPSRDGVSFSTSPQIWFWFESWRCHTCTQRGRKGLLLTCRGFWKRSVGLQAGPKMGRGSRERSLAWLLSQFAVGSGWKSPTRPGLACWTFSQAPREGAPGLCYQLGQMWKGGEEGLGRGQAVGSRAPDSLTALSRAFR